MGNQSIFVDIVLLPVQDYLNAVHILVLKEMLHHQQEYHMKNLLILILSFVMLNRIFFFSDEYATL
jgi:hypothetical protein